MSIYVAILVLTFTTGVREEKVQAFSTQKECKVYIVNETIALPSKQAYQRSVCNYFHSEWFPSEDSLKWCAENVDNLVSAAYKCKES